MNRCAIFALLFICTAIPAFAEPVRNPDRLKVDCDIVRHYVAENGRAKALAWAIREGYSWKQISMARKCLK